MRANLRNPQSQISQVTIQLAKIFAAYETPPRHTCAISQVQNPISQLWTNLWNPQSQISQVHISTCETPPRHMCAISQLQNQISQLRINLRTNLRKYQPSFKFLFKPLILAFFILHSHSKLRSPKISEDPLHRKTRSRASEKDHSAHLRVPYGHEPLHFSHGQDEKSPSRISISSQHQIESFTCVRFHVWGSTCLCHSTFWGWSAT